MVRGKGEFIRIIRIFPKLIHGLCSAEFREEIDETDTDRYPYGRHAAKRHWTQIVPREDINETVKRPLESEMWSGCVDAVGGAMLARVLGQMKYGASVSAVGLAGGAALPATVVPFLLRGVNLLGIDSVMQPYDNRLAAWKRVASDLPMDKLSAMIQPATLEDLPRLGAEILKGQVRGRVVVDVNA